MKFNRPLCIKCNKRMALLFVFCIIFISSACDKKAVISEKRKTKYDSSAGSEGELEYAPGGIKEGAPVVQFLIPESDYIPIEVSADRFSGFDIHYVWDSQNQKLTPGNDFNENKYRVIFQFRQYNSPSVNSTEEGVDSLGINYPKQEGSRRGRLRLSKEYPGLVEYYLPYLDTSHHFYLEYTLDSQVVKEIISCRPGFRRDEKLKLYDLYNSFCGFSVVFSNRSYVSVTFDSRMLAEAKVFHSRVAKEISKFINRL